MTRPDKRARLDAGAVPARHFPRGLGRQPRLQFRRPDPGRRRRLDDDVDRHRRPTWSRWSRPRPTLPIMLFSLVAGAIADSFDRRKVMLIAQSFMLVVSVLLTVFTYLGLLTPWLLLAFTFLIGSGTALNSPSWQASVGDMVPRAELPAAVALNSHGLQPDAQRRPGDRRHHRRGRRRRRRLRGQRRELYRPDRRAGALEAGSCRPRPCRASRWARPWAPACAMSPCRPTSARCWSARLPPSASAPAPSWRCCRWWRATSSRAAP